jgi:hypothetical protein
VREALTVWNPFADELLGWWLESRIDGKVAAPIQPAWLRSGRQLARRYRELAKKHTACTKHRRPRENLAILTSCLKDVVSGGDLTGRQRGLLQHAVDSMVRRRGSPGSAEHRALRARQTRDAALPTHSAVAEVVGARLAGLPQELGMVDIAAVLRPVRAGECDTVGATTAVPVPLARLVRRATAAPMEELIDAGIVGSAEVLAELVPQVTARTFTATYPDPQLRTLMAATCRAFRARRSLLLLDLQHQVRISELPWIAATTAVRAAGDDARAEAAGTLASLGEAGVMRSSTSPCPTPTSQPSKATPTMRSRAARRLSPRRSDRYSPA